MSTLQQRSCDLSVIIPVYNLERFLYPILRSLKMQKLGEYSVEYIFVLNNCMDNSEQVIRDSGIECQILNCTEQGCGPSRNKGFEVSCGEYVWFIDGDDWLLSDTAIHDVLTKAKAEDLDVLRIPFQSNHFTMQYFSMVWQYLLRRSFVEGIRFPSIQPQEDDIYMAMVLRKLGLNAYTYMALPSMPEPLYYYNYLREGSNMYRHIILHERI